MALHVYTYFLPIIYYYYHLGFCNSCFLLNVYLIKFLYIYHMFIYFVLMGISVCYIKMFKNKRKSIIYNIEDDT